jgi:hypothetical protein
MPNRNHAYSEKQEREIFVLTKSLKEIAASTDRFLQLIIGILFHVNPIVPFHARNTR